MGKEKESKMLPLITFEILFKLYPLDENCRDSVFQYLPGTFFLRMPNSVSDIFFNCSNRR
jgi:hypothetical protein